MFFKRSLLQASAIAFTGIALSVGCETREKVVDIETPSGSIEVEKTEKKDGSVDIDINKKKKLVDVDVPGVDVEVEKKPNGGVDVDVEKK